jgi:hypothetical protein
MSLSLHSRASPNRSVVGEPTILDRVMQNGESKTTFHESCFSHHLLCNYQKTGEKWVIKSATLHLQYPPSLGNVSSFVHSRSFRARPFLPLRVSYGAQTFELFSGRKELNLLETCTVFASTIRVDGCRCCQSCLSVS